MYQMVWLESALCSVLYPGGGGSSINWVPFGRVRGTLRSNLVKIRIWTLIDHSR
jgi:hypothetical protein